VLDDTSTTPEQIVGAFGPAVSAMVVKVSKLSQVNQMLRRDKRKVGSCVIPALCNAVTVTWPCCKHAAMLLCTRE
jgi:(p)ppGpp synthase/HD superfamily hydrolase